MLRFRFPFALINLCIDECRIGIWTSSDSVNPDGLPSDWTNDFPALCMHRHAWPLYTFRQMAGLQFTAEGLVVRPALPPELGTYEWSSSLASIRWDGDRTWTGHYAPSAAGSWKVVVDMRHTVFKGTVLAVSVWLARDAHDTNATIGGANAMAVEGAGLVEVRSPHAASGAKICFAVVATSNSA